MGLLVTVRDRLLAHSDLALCPSLAEHQAALSFRGRSMHCHGDRRLAKRSHWMPLPLQARQRDLAGSEHERIPKACVHLHGNERLSQVTRETRAHAGIADVLYDALRGHAGRVESKAILLPGDLADVAQSPCRKATAG